MATSLGECLRLVAVFRHHLAEAVQTLLLADHGRCKTKKAKLLLAEATRLSQKTRDFPTPFYNGFGFISDSAAYYKRVTSEQGLSMQRSGTRVGVCKWQ
jgi:hypothetical protein